MDKQVKTQIPNQKQIQRQQPIPILEQIQIQKQTKMKIKIQNLEKEIQTQRQMQIQKQIQKQKKRVEVEQGKKDLLMDPKEMEMQLKNPLLMKIFQIMLSSYSSSWNSQLMSGMILDICLLRSISPCLEKRSVD